jgi:leucine-zipper-like transcriptional regulator 1
MYVFDFPTATWTEIQALGTLPSARSCPAWAKDATHVYIQGGYDGVERKSDFFALDLETYTWTEMPGLGTPPSPRYFHSCCLYGHRMYLYGGFSGAERLADMYAYDFDTHHWSQVDCTRGDAPSGRSSLVTQVYNNSIYVFGTQL